MKQYFSYFKLIFIILGILVVLVGCGTLMKYVTGGRSNYRAPEERVYDFADVLTDSEEDELRKLIADRERKIGCDIVLVTVNMSVLDYYGFTENTDANWEYGMETYADDFYDTNNYGYNVDFEGDGVLLLDNWYEGENGSEKGSWLSTSGRVYRRFSSSMIDGVLNDVDDLVEVSPYRAYRAYVEDIYRQMSNKNNSLVSLLSPFGLFIISMIVAAVFILTNLKTKEGTKTTVASTYVENGSIHFNEKSDKLVNKFVTSRVIQTSSGGGGGSGHSGGGGGHHSSSGASHGGGGHRR
ncbi:MAG: TPM domain-containing protein [Lachnospiraceae bacterium]|nr:TPM domain-containing protein [Lachnospiraceae bacterium]